LAGISRQALIENRRKSLEAERQVYGKLVEAGFYFRRYFGFCDIIGRVGSFWVLIEVKVTEAKEERISFSPFNTRLTLKMARDLKGLVYLVIRFNGDYCYMRGERLMSSIARRKAKATSVRLGKWKTELRPLEELIKELETIRGVTRSK